MAATDALSPEPTDLAPSMQTGPRNVPGDLPTPLTPGTPHSWAHGPGIHHAGGLMDLSQVIQALTDPLLPELVDPVPAM